MPRPRLMALWATLVGAGLATEELAPQRATVRCTLCGYELVHDRARAATTQRGRGQMFGHLLNQHQAAYAAALEQGKERSFVDDMGLNDVSAAMGK